MSSTSSPSPSPTPPHSLQRDILVFVVLLACVIIAMFAMAEFDVILRRFYNLDDDKSNEDSSSSSGVAHDDNNHQNLHRRRHRHHRHHQNDTNSSSSIPPHYFLSKNFGNTHEDNVRLHLLHLDLFQQRQQLLKNKQQAKEDSSKTTTTNSKKKNANSKGKENTPPTTLSPSEILEKEEADYEDDEFVEFHPVQPEFRTEWISQVDPNAELMVKRRYANWDKSHPIPKREVCPKIKERFVKKRLEDQANELKEKKKEKKYKKQEEEEEKNVNNDNNNNNDDSDDDKGKNSATTTTAAANKKSSSSASSNTDNEELIIEPVEDKPQFINNTILQPVFFSNPRPKIAILTMHSVQVTSDSSSTRSKVQRASLIPLMWYCKKHRYDLIVEDHDIVDPRRAPAWSKVRALRKWLPHYEWVIWMDMDVIITNHDKSIEAFIQHRENIVRAENVKKLKEEKEKFLKVKHGGGKVAAHIAKKQGTKGEIDGPDQEFFSPPKLRPLPHILIGSDWNGINSGITMWRNSTFTLGFVKRMWGVPKELAQPFWDQGAMRYLLYRNFRGRDETAADYDYSHLDINDEVNRYPVGLLMWGRNTDAVKWKDGDFLVHFASCKFFETCVPWMNYFSHYVGCAWGAPLWGTNVTMAKPFYRTDIPEAQPPPMDEILEPYPTQLHQYNYHTPKKMVFREQHHGAVKEAPPSSSASPQDASHPPPPSGLPFGHHLHHHHEHDYEHDSHDNKKKVLREKKMLAKLKKHLEKLENGEA